MYLAHADADFFFGGSASMHSNDCAHWQDLISYPLSGQIISQ